MNHGIEEDGRIVVARREKWHGVSDEGMRSILNCGEILEPCQRSGTDGGEMGTGSSWWRNSQGVSGEMASDRDTL